MIGNLFSPIMASTITGTTRAMLYDFVHKNRIESEVVSFATDSIITTKKLNIDSTKLGDFSYDNSGNDDVIKYEAYDVIKYEVNSNQNERRSRRY